MGIPLELMDDKNGISIFTTESAATPIPTDDYAFPVNPEDAQKSDHRVPPKDSNVFVACAASCSIDLERYPSCQPGSLVQPRACAVKTVSYCDESDLSQNRKDRCGACELQARQPDISACL